MRLLMRLLMLLVIGGCTVEFPPGRSVRPSVQSTPPLISDSFALLHRHGFLLCASASLRLVGHRTWHAMNVGPSGVLRLTGSSSEDAPGLCVNACGGGWRKVLC